MFAVMLKVQRSTRIPQMDLKLLPILSGKPDLDPDLGLDLACHLFSRVTVAQPPLDSLKGPVVSSDGLLSRAISERRDQPAEMPACQVRANSGSR